MSLKVRKTVTLDPDVVETFGEDATTLSSVVNAVLREEMDRRHQRAALGRFVAELDAQFGQPDPADVARFRQALT
jgi:hypothetical protein